MNQPQLEHRTAFYTFLPATGSLQGSNASVTPRGSRASAHLHPLWRAKTFTLIVKTALRDLQQARLDAVDHAMLARDAPGPESAQVSLQRLGFAQSGKRMALNIFDQHIDLVTHLSIRTRPVKVILPGSRRPDYSHRISLRARPRPALRSRTALASRAALGGLDIR